MTPFISRKEALQQLALFSIGSGLMPSILNKGNDPLIQNNTNSLQPFTIASSRKELKEDCMGMGIRTLVHQAQTEGKFSCIETYIAPRQMGPAPHIHKELNEMMLVTKGTVGWIVGDEFYEVSAGGWIFRPHGIIHTFWNPTDQPALAIDMFFGQNFEDYLDKLFHQIFPEMLKKGLKPNSPDIAIKLKNLDKIYNISRFPERRQPIIEKFNLKR